MCVQAAMALTWRASVRSRAYAWPRASVRGHACAHILWLL